MTVGSDQRGEGRPSGTDTAPPKPSGGEPPLREVLDQIRRTRSGAADQLGPRTRGVGAPPPFDHRSTAGGAGPGSLLGGGLTTPPQISQDELKTQAGRAESGITSTETSVPTAWSGATEVSEPLFATEASQPALYAQPDDEARPGPRSSSSPRAGTTPSWPPSSGMLARRRPRLRPRRTPRSWRHRRPPHQWRPPRPWRPDAPTWDAVVAATAAPTAPSTPTVAAPAAPGEAATNGHRPHAIAGVAGRVGVPPHARHRHPVRRRGARHPVGSAR